MRRVPPRSRTQAQEKQADGERIYSERCEWWELRAEATNRGARGRDLDGPGPSNSLERWTTCR